MLGSVATVMGFYASMVNKARLKYDVKWPFLMVRPGRRRTSLLVHARIFFTHMFGVARS